MLQFFSCVCCIWSTPVMGLTGTVEEQGLKTSQFVCVAMKISQEMSMSIGTMMMRMISTVVDQILALSLRVGQRVLGDKHVSQNTPTIVEIYRYPQRRPVTVEQSNLQRVIMGILITNSVVPPPGPASATCHQMEMVTVMEQSRLETNMLVVTLECVTAEVTLPADLEINVLRSIRCVTENLSVKICLMWSFVT